MPIKIDCYLGKLKTIRAINKALILFDLLSKKKYPEPHFEYVNNYNLLAPSKELKIRAGVEKKKDGSKNPLMNFKEYSKLYVEELMNNSKKISRMAELKQMAKEKDVYLICYCKDKNKCHRKILKEVILKLEE